MSKFSKLGLRRALGAAAVAAAAVAGVAGMGAGEAAAAKLPNGYKKVVGIDGEVVQTWRTHEDGYAIPTVANNPAARGFVISGTYSAQASKGVGGNLAVKYIIGCQVNIEVLTLGLGASLSLSAAGLSGTLSLPLTPGQVAVVDITDKDLSSKGPTSIQLSQLAFNLNNCGGFASVRSVAKVIAAKGFSTDDGTVNGSGSLIQSTLYGKPFSIN